MTTQLVSKQNNDSTHYPSNTLFITIQGHHLGVYCIVSSIPRLQTHRKALVFTAGCVITPFQCFSMAGPAMVSTPSPHPMNHSRH